MENRKVCFMSRTRNWSQDLPATPGGLSRLPGNLQKCSVKLLYDLRQLSKCQQLKFIFMSSPPELASSAYRAFHLLP